MIRTKKLITMDKPGILKTIGVKFFTEQMIVLEFSHAGKSGIILEII